MRRGGVRSVPAGLGKWGMHEFVEPHVRRLVAEHLGVRAEELLSEVSLREDLAADSLDLLELAMAVEAEFAIVVPERVLDRVRTYGDLVQAAGLLIRTRCKAEARGAEQPSRVSVRIVGSAGASRGSFERTSWLTSYAAETITEDAVRAGRGARVEVTVAASTPAGLARVRRKLAGLGERGIEVSVRHDDRPPGPWVESTADRVTQRNQVAAAGARRVLTHRLLDQLTGARTGVTLTDYVGDDPWQADDLIASAGEHAKRFGDATVAEQGQALSGTGPCRFMDGEPAGGYRATSEGHHVHAHFDRPQGEVPRAADDVADAASPHLGIGPGGARYARYFHSDLCSGVGSNGEMHTWREATYYSEDRAQRVFSVASSITEPTTPGHLAGRQEGLRAQFDLSVPSPNGFRARTATLDRAGDDGASALLIVVSAKMAGTERLAQVTLRRGPDATMDVRLLPRLSGSEVGAVASP